MNVTVEIDSTSIKERQIKSERGAFTVRDQIGWLNLPGKRYPQEIVVSLEEGQVPYEVGTYRVKEESITIDKFKRIAFQRSLELERIERKDSAQATGTD